MIEVIGRLAVVLLMFVIVFTPPFLLYRYSLQSLDTGDD